MQLILKQGGKTLVEVSGRALSVEWKSATEPLEGLQTIVSVDPETKIAQLSDGVSSFLAYSCLTYPRAGLLRPKQAGGGGANGGHAGRWGWGCWEPFA